MLEAPMLIARAGTRGLRLGQMSGRNRLLAISYPVTNILHYTLGFAGSDRGDGTSRALEMLMLLLLFVRASSSLPRGNDRNHEKSRIHFPCSCTSHETRAPTIDLFRDLRPESPARTTAL